MNLPDVTAEIKAAVAAEIKQYPVNNNWASSLGHPCTRNLVYRRLDWDKLPLIPVERKMLFDGGNVIEKHVAKVYLEKAGYDIVEQQRPLVWPEKQISGRLDFMIKRADLPFEIPVEVKSMEHGSWKRIEAIEDMLFSKKTWHRNYPAQLTTYMLQKGAEIGMFLNISKLTYEPKHIWVNLDYAYAEELIQKAEAVNAAVAKKEYPERIPYDASICDKCEFAFMCLQDIKRTEAVLIDDPAIEAKADRLMEISGAASEAKEIKDDLEDDLAHCERAIIGTKYQAEWKPSKQPSYDLPLNVENQVKALKEPYKTFGRTLQIRPIGGKKEDQ